MPCGATVAVPVVDTQNFKVNGVFSTPASISDCPDPEQ
jgi:hypothetical protein